LKYPLDIPPNRAIDVKRLIKRYSDPNLVLIYQFGKVGSTTLAASIEGAVNVHDLYGNPICPAGFNLRNKWSYRKIGFPVDRLFRRVLLNRRKKIDIIVPVREPAGRNLSMFFQDLSFWYVKHFANNRAYAKSEGMDLLKEVFTKSFDHDGADRWFEKEFCRFTGLDFEQMPFNKEAGFEVIENGKCRCLLLTTEFMRRDEGKAKIETFLGRSFEWENQNRGENKWYADAYRQFQDDASFVDTYRARMKQSKVYQKFFGDSAAG
jgi:hypothetical protein